MKFLKIFHLTEGNKQLARKVVNYIKKRDKLSHSEWRQNLLPMINELQDEINNLILGYDSFYWSLTNLKAIRSAIETLVARFEARFSDGLTKSQIAMAEMTTASMTEQFRALGLASPFGVFNVSSVLGGVSPLTQSIVSHFGSDMARTISTQIAIGMSGGLSTFEVAQAIRDKFESSDMSIARAQRIAMTEMNTMASYAQEVRGQEMFQTNKDLRKVWINSHKPNARKSHIEVERDSIKEPLELDELFKVRNESNGAIEDGLFPRDPRLSAGNRVHCGCTIIYVNKGDTESLNLIKSNLK